MLKFFSDIFRFRLVFIQLIEQHLSLRYRRTWLGFLWTLANPLLTMIVTSVIFSLMMRFPLKSFAVFLFSALIPWNLLSSCITIGGNAIIDNEALIKKVYLPKQVLVLSKCVALLCEALLSFTALFAIAIFIGAPLTSALLLLPFAFFLLFCFASGLAMVMSVVCVHFRDTAHIVAILLQAGYYLTPVIYPVSIVPERFRIWFEANPMYHFIGMFRSIIYEGTFPSGQAVMICAALALSSFAIGTYVLKRFSRGLIFRL